MQNKPETYLHAGFFVRLAAYLLDSLIVGAALLVVRIPLLISSLASPDNIVVRDFIFSYSIADIVLYLLGVSYFIILTYKTGATVGKRMMHLRVVSTEDRKPTLFEIIYRETVGRFLSALVANVGYIMIGIQKDKHGLHDMLSDTEVIYYHEKKVYVELQSELAEVAGAVCYTAASYVEAEQGTPEENIPAEGVLEESVSEESVSEEVSVNLTEVEKRSEEDEIMEET